MVCFTSNRRSRSPWLFTRGIDLFRFCCRQYRRFTLLVYVSGCTYRATDEYRNDIQKQNLFLTINLRHSVRFPRASISLMYFLPNMLIFKPTKSAFFLIIWFKCLPFVSNNKDASMPLSKSKSNSVDIRFRELLWWLTA